MAELAPEIKNSISHRSRALAKLSIEDFKKLCEYYKVSADELLEIKIN